MFMDNCCMCNTAAFMKTTGVQHDDIVYASLKNDVSGLIDKRDHRVLHEIQLF